MKRKFHDPNNHVPEAAPSDSWEEEVSDEWDDGTQALLPKKRGADEMPAGFREIRKDEVQGVEIDIKVIEKPAAREDGKVHRLEVQEHVPKLLAAEAEPPPKVVPKQIIEKMAVDPEAENTEWISGASEGENWGKQKTVPMRWLVTSGCIVAVLLFTAVILLPKLRWQGEEDSRSYLSRIEVDNSDKVVEEPKSNEAIQEGVEDAAKALAHAYATATKVEDVLPLVRDRQRVEPFIRARWKPLGLRPTWQVPDESQWALRKAGDRDYGYLAGEFPDVRRFYFYFVTEGKRTVLDWEASSAFSETPWEDLSKGKGAGGLARCLLSPGDLYTFSVPEADYQCYRLSSIDGEVSVWGYVKRSEPLAEELANLFKPGAIPREIQNEYAVTVRLVKANADSLPNQWLITAMPFQEFVSP